MGQTFYSIQIPLEAEEDDSHPNNQFLQHQIYSTRHRLPSQSSKHQQHILSKECNLLIAFNGEELAKADSLEVISKIEFNPLPLPNVKGSVKHSFIDHQSCHTSVCQGIETDPELNFV